MPRSRFSPADYRWRSVAGAVATRRCTDLGTSGQAVPLVAWSDAPLRTAEELTVLGALLCHAQVPPYSTLSSLPLDCSSGDGSRSCLSVRVIHLRGCTQLVVLGPISTHPACGRPACLGWRPSCAWASPHDPTACRPVSLHQPLLGASTGMLALPFPGDRVSHRFTLCCLVRPDRARTGALRSIPRYPRLHLSGIRARHRALPSPAGLRQLYPP